MSKYINQKRLLMSLSDWQFGSQDDEQLWETIETVINSIESLPTIDIVECEECRWRNECSQTVSNIEGTVHTALRWCSDGRIEE